MKIKGLIIVGILCVFTMFGSLFFFAERGKKTKEEICIASISRIIIGLQAYKADWGKYPEQINSGELDSKFWQSLKNKNGLYYFDIDGKNIKRKNGEITLVDSYDRPFYYKCPGDKNKSAFDLWSTGPDLKHGSTKSTNPDDALKNESKNCDDIGNWQTVFSDLMIAPKKNSESVDPM